MKRTARPRRPAIALAAGVLLMGASASSRALEEPAGPGAQCRIARVEALLRDGSRVRPAGRRAAVSAAETREIVFRVRLRPVHTGVRRLELKVRAPGGYLFRSFSAAVTPSAAGLGAPAPLLASDALRRGGDGPAPSTPEPRRRWAIDLRLPVAGSLIVSHSLYGPWTAEAFVDGDETPCGPARTFRIDP
jgi:hypothetical protein